MLLDTLLLGGWDCSLRSDTWRELALLLLEGEAKRESCLRKTDLRLGGAGSIDASIGGVGILRPGKLSRSLACRSTISCADLVSVRLWVGAARGVSKSLAGRRGTGEKQSRIQKAASMGTASVCDEQRLIQIVQATMCPRKQLPLNRNIQTSRILRLTRLSCGA